ncbi:hypothetical protein BDM02DRAFT_1693162 [Thelephora ganbajun]|uniref:Uncharacterized protein n=1 Tax=Thelephora ganbajun TaxID=370292 RepID=A0ACB6Z136_THEGA|nr:hypothetical protein BDM02DRAFT_1693162 [Thelephora ganbajun]
MHRYLFQGSVVSAIGGIINTIVTAIADIIIIIVNSIVATNRIESRAFQPPTETRENASALPSSPSTLLLDAVKSGQTRCLSLSGWPALCIQIFGFRLNRLGGSVVLTNPTSTSQFRPIGRLPAPPVNNLSFRFRSSSSFNVLWTYP